MVYIQEVPEKFAITTDTTNAYTPPIYTMIALDTTNQFSLAGLPLLSLGDYHGKYN